MTHTQLAELAEMLAAIAAGADWECQWNYGYAHPGGRDIEYCLANRIPIRLKPPSPKDLLTAAAPEMLEMLKRCEMWLSTLPEGRRMQLECQRVINLATQPPNPTIQ